MRTSRQKTSKDHFIFDTFINTDPVDPLSVHSNLQKLALFQFGEDVGEIFNFFLVCNSNMFCCVQYSATRKYLNP